MADANAAIGFAASLTVQVMGVAASALVGKITTDRLEKKAAQLGVPLPSDFGPDTTKDYVYWGIDAVTAISTLVGPVVALLLLLPTLGVQVATILNLVAAAMSFVMFVIVARQDDPVIWVGKYVFKTASWVTVTGAVAYVVLGAMAWGLATPPVLAPAR